MRQDPPCPGLQTRSSIFAGADPHLRETRSASDLTKSASTGWHNHDTELEQLHTERAEIDRSLYRQALRLEEHEDHNHPVIILATQWIEELSARRASIEHAIHTLEADRPTPPAPTTSNRSSTPSPTSGRRSRPRPLPTSPNCSTASRSPPSTTSPTACSHSPQPSPTNPPPNTKNPDEAGLRRGNLP